MARLFPKFFGTSFVQETPSGSVNGSNTQFSLSQTPASASAVIFQVDGTVLKSSEFSVSGTTVTTTVAPATGQSVYASYLKAK